MGFPIDRPRRLRQREVFRRMVRETVVDVDDLIYPLFAVHGTGVAREVASMPGVFQYSVDRLVKEAAEVAALGIPAVILFGIPRVKDAAGSEAWDDDGIIPRAVRALKDQVPDLAVITDVCLCEYTDHGHCGLVKDGVVQNDPTVERLVAEALAHARAGADIVAPSDMMDGGWGRSGGRSTPRGLPTRRSWPTRPSTPRDFTGPSATRRNRRPNSATGAGIKWIRPTPTRPSARWRWTWRRGPTS